MFFSFLLVTTELLKNKITHFATSEEIENDS